MSPLVIVICFMGESISIFDLSCPFVHILSFWTIFWGPLLSLPGMAMFETIVVSVSAYISCIFDWLDWILLIKSSRERPAANRGDTRELAIKITRSELESFFNM